MSKNMLQNEKVIEAKRLISLNEDSRQYFFEKANETWLEWLWENGFFEILKEKAKDSNRVSYQLPELRYLVRMTELNPEVVTKILLDTQISNESFNPEVIYQFLHICSSLPGKHLAKLINKIKTENWPSLLQMYNQWGIIYSKMFDGLEKSGYHEELLELASLVLNLREDWETEAKEEYLDPTPFCIKELSYSKVFNYLAIIDENLIENTIDLLLSVLKELSSLKEKDRKFPSVFANKDRYPLYDIDIFTISLRSEYHHPGHDDVQEIVALIKILTERMLIHRCTEKAKRFYERYFESLPDSWLMWRIRLFVLNLCPLELMPYLKNALNRIFKEDRYTELIMGAEYRKALMKAFPLMDKVDQSRFVNLAKDLFSQTSDEDDEEKESLIKRDGSRIFSVIGDNLSDDQIVELLNAGFEINPEYYVPNPIAGMGEFGIVNAKGPVTQDEFRVTPVSTILDKLKDVWSPNQLVKQDVQRDFLNPLNAEGMGKLIVEDVHYRLDDYLEHANEFLDHDNIDLHYLCSFISGVAKAIDGNKELLKIEHWEILISTCLQLLQKMNEVPVERLDYEIKENNAWLSRWNSVYSAVVHLLKKVLAENGKNLGFDWNSHRFEILSTIEYLFNHPDPKTTDENIKSAKMTETIGGKKPLVSDPFNMAINSIRGQAFELFVSAVELDTEKDNREKNIELSADIKRLYENLLSKEETRAIMFMFGRYLPFFFYRDRTWLKSILHKIFPTAQEKKYLHLAALEGYLTNSLYLELFNDEKFISIYKKAIVSPEKDYPHQKHFLDPDEGIAQHFAIAYMYTDFNFGNELFTYFWTNGTLNQHINFVDRIGRFFVSSNNPKTLKLFSKNEKARIKIKYLWDWLLDNYSDPAVFNGIGFWINLEKDIFQPNELANYLAKTLVKTNGCLNWEIGLQKNIVSLAKGSPVDSLEIARLYFLEGFLLKGMNTPYYLDDNWIEGFRILYSHPTTKQPTLSLISELIQNGGSFFWPLKKVYECS